MKFGMDISGAKELGDLLQQLPTNVARRAAGNALRAGARIIRDEAKRRAPIGPQASLGGANQPGQLRRSIKVRMGKSTKATRRRVIVIVTNKDAGINPHWIEYGTVANRIRKKSGGSTGGIRAQPFMRTAADKMARAAVAEIGASLGAAIEKEAVKLGGGGGRARRR